MGLEMGKGKIFSPGKRKMKKFTIGSAPSRSGAYYHIKRDVSRLSQTIFYFLSSSHFSFQGAPRHARELAGELPPKHVRIAASRPVDASIG